MIEETKVVRVVCPRNCPDRCSVVAYVKAGKLVKVKGDPDHPITRGALCVKMDHAVERVYSPLRVAHPQRRIGPKGDGRFARISWDEALDTIAARLHQIAADDGPEAILPFAGSGSLGHLSWQGLDSAFFNRLGASRLARTICSVAGHAAFGYTTGAKASIDPEGFAHSKLIIAWGINILSTNVHMYPLIGEARRRGALFVVIDPHRTRTAERADWYLQPRPGTDAALALGMMNVIINEDLYDKRFVVEHTVGFEQLRRRVQEYPPERAAAITGLANEDIVKLARLYAERQPAAIRCGPGLQRHTNGGMMMRAVTCLPALVGAWGKLGGGLLYSNLNFASLNFDVLRRPDLLVGNPRTININRAGEALLETRPPVKALFVYSANPAAVCPNQRKVLAGLRRDDLFTVVLDPIMTDTALYADILLPATTEFEHLDLTTSYWHLYVQLSEPAIAPVGESRSNFDVFGLLGQRMGFDEDCFRLTPDEAIRGLLRVDHPFLAGIDLPRLRRDGWARFATPDGPHVPFANGQFPSPSGKIELYCDRLASEGHDPLPLHVPPRESAESTPDLSARFPLSLITPSAHHFLNSTYNEIDALRLKEGVPTVELHIADAEERGLATGDWARVYNDRGECFMRVRAGDTVPRGVACTASGWWHRYSPEGANCNHLTSDALADFAGGSTFHTNLVEVERRAG